ncbi:hypothetical protein D3C72_1498750 [compost metagenome]
MGRLVRFPVFQHGERVQSALGAVQAGKAGQGRATFFGKSGAAFGIEAAHAAQVAGKMAAADKFGKRKLGLYRHAAMDQAGKIAESADELWRQHEIANANAGIEGLAEAAGIDHAFMAVDGPHGWQRRAIITEFTVIVVLDDPGFVGPRPFEKSKPAGQG